MSSPHFLPHHCRCSSASLPPSLIRQGHTAADEADGQGAAGAPLPQDMQGGEFPSLDLLPIDSWSEPPRDVLECVLDKLKEHRDILLFSSVCEAWRSFTLDNLQLFPRELPLSRCLPQQCRLPLLIFPSKEAAKACDFFCVFEQKLYGGTPLRDSNKWRICGSSKGWLAIVDLCGPEIALFNPISRDQIYLPSKTEIPIPKIDRNQIGFQTYDYLCKAALSKSLASNIDDCVIMAIMSANCVLCFCRPGDSKWTSVPDSPKYVADVIYYKEQFYAVNVYGVVLACEIGPIPKTTSVVGRPNMHDDDDIYYWRRYIVESQGELLQLVRITQNDGVTVYDHRTVEFLVFQLQEKSSEDYEDKEDNVNEEYVRMDVNVDEKIVPVEDTSYKWVKLDNLGDQVIFLGFNQSFSLPACELPNSRGNSIYFTDDNKDYYYGRLFGYCPEERTDMGVFNLDDGSVHHFNPKSLGFPLPPIWVSPAPW